MLAISLQYTCLIYEFSVYLCCVLNHAAINRYKIFFVVTNESDYAGKIQNKFIIHVTYIFKFMFYMDRSSTADIQLYSNQQRSKDQR